MAKLPTAAVLKALRTQLGGTTDKFERAELSRKIRETAALEAKAQYRAKAGPLLRSMAGGY